MNTTNKESYSPQDVYTDIQNQNTLTSTSAPYHFHNGSDSPNIPFYNIVARQLYLPVIIQGTSAATKANYGVFFTAPFSGVFMGATEVHQTAGSDGSAVGLNIEHLTGTQASGAGVALLQTNFDMKGTANTVQTGTLAFISKTSFQFIKGDRFGLVPTGTYTNVAHVVVVVNLQY